MRSRVSRRAALVPLGLGLVAAAPQEPARPFDIPFAERSFDGWRAAATTRVEYEKDARGNGPFPYVEDVVCRVQRNGMMVTLDRKGRLAVLLIGEIPTADDDDPNLGLTGIRSLQVDGVSYEAKAVQTLHVQRKFADFDYPRFEDDDVILPVFGGHIAVRRHPREPWLHIVTLLPELVRGRSLRIGHGRTVDGHVPRVDYLTLPLAGLGEALKWCEGQIVSSAAYRLHRR